MAFLDMNIKAVAARAAIASTDQCRLRLWWLTSADRQYGVQTSEQFAVRTRWVCRNPTEAFANQDGLTVTLDPQILLCRGQDGACPAAATDQSTDLSAWVIGGEATRALQVVLGEAGGRQKGDQETVATWFHRYVIKYTLWKSGCSTTGSCRCTFGYDPSNARRGGPPGLRPGRYQKDAVGRLLGHRPTCGLGLTGATAGSLQNA
jgi:hypothetical protein